MGKIVALFNVVGYTAEQYSKVIEDHETAGTLKDPAYIHRVVAQQADGLLIIDVWESEEALSSFADTLVPILVKHGPICWADPRLGRVDNVYTSR